MIKEQFIGTLENWDGHRNFLWKALEATDGNVIEMGCGNGSTKQLHEYCEYEDRLLFSYEYNFEWYKKFKNLNCIWHDVSWIDLETDWNIVSEIHENCGVVLIDHSPGHRRKIDIDRLANKVQILVIHDTEKEADHGYQMLAEINKLKYIVHDETFDARTTMCSNFIDVSKL